MRNKFGRCCIQLRDTVHHRVVDSRIMVDASHFGQRAQPFFHLVDVNTGLFADYATEYVAEQMNVVAELLV